MDETIPVFLLFLFDMFIVFLRVVFAFFFDFVTDMPDFFNDRIS